MFGTEESSLVVLVKEMHLDFSLSSRLGRWSSLDFADSSP